MLVFLELLTNVPRRSPFSYTHSMSELSHSTEETISLGSWELSVGDEIRNNNNNNGSNSSCGDSETSKENESNLPQQAEMHTKDECAQRPLPRERYLPRPPREMMTEKCEKGKRGNKRKTNVVFNEHYSNYHKLDYVIDKPISLAMTNDIHKLVRICLWNPSGFEKGSVNYSTLKEDYAEVFEMCVRTLENKFEMLKIGEESWPADMFIYEIVRSDRSLYMFKQRQGASVKQKGEIPAPKKGKTRKKSVLVKSDTRRDATNKKIVTSDTTAAAAESNDWYDSKNEESDEDYCPSEDASVKTKSVRGLTSSSRVRLKRTTRWWSQGIEINSKRKHVKEKVDKKGLGVASKGKISKTRYEDENASALHMRVMAALKGSEDEEVVYAESDIKPMQVPQNWPVDMELDVQD